MIASVLSRLLQYRLGIRSDAVLVSPPVRAFLTDTLVNAVGVVPRRQEARNPLARVNGVDESRIQLDTAAGLLRFSHDRILKRDRCRAKETVWQGVTTDDTRSAKYATRSVASLAGVMFGACGGF